MADGTEVQHGDCVSSLGARRGAPGHYMEYSRGGFQFGEDHGKDAEEPHPSCGGLQRGT